MVRTEIVRKSSNTIRLDQWRNEKTLVASAGRIWADADFQMMMDTLRNEHPAWGVLNPASNNEIRAARQALCEGYTLAIANLEAMKSLKKIVELEQPTFEQE